MPNRQVGVGATNQDILEQMIDANSVAYVLGLVSEICQIKSEHLRSAWQDDTTGRTWEDVADKIAKLAARVRV